MDPITAKSLRLTQTAPQRSIRGWSIAELFLYEEAPPAAPPDPAVRLRAGALEPVLQFIKERGITRVFSSDEASPLLARVLPPKVSVTLYDSRFLPVEASERVVRFRRRRAFLLAADSPALEATFRHHGVAFGRHEVSGIVVYVSEPRRAAVPLYWDHDQLLAVTPLPA